MASSPLAPADPSSLHGSSALFTGAASGLGASTAAFFAEQGAYVTIADIQDGSAFATSLKAKGFNIQHVHCDVTDYASQVAAFKAALAFSPNGALDFVGAFAGVDTCGPLVDHVASASSGLPPPEPGLGPLEVNVKGTVFTATLAMHYLGSPEGSAASKALVLVGSMAGYVDDTHDTVYTASKFGIRGLFRAIRGDAKEKLGVRVNIVCPWAMETPMTAPVLGMLKSMGIEAHTGTGKGSGITLVEHDVIVQAVTRVAVDESICGRAIAIMPEGAIDLGDDLEGRYSGVQLAELMQLRKEAGDFLHS